MPGPTLPHLPAWRICVERLHLAFRRGHCWACQTSGHVDQDMHGRRRILLIADPMGTQDDTGWMSLCVECASRRRVIAQRYESMGKMLTPDRRVEPIA